MFAWDLRMPQMRSLAAAACGTRLDTLPLANLNSRLVVYRSGSHALLDLTGHGQESLLDVRGVLC